MRITKSWLEETIGQGFSITGDQLEKDCIALGIEVENRDPVVAFTGPVVVARVRDYSQLEGFKKPIRLCSVEIGQEAPATIVCGATNFTAGDYVVAALPGAVLPGDFAIAARKTYGHVSEGMLCAAAELGFAIDGEDKPGIIILDEATNPVPGTPIAKQWKLDESDEVFDLEITPDRGYLLSLRGLARELVAYYSVQAVRTGSEKPPYAPFEDPASAPKVSSEKLSGLQPDVAPVMLGAETKVQRFSLCKVEDYDSRVSTPEWMRSRLEYAGIRSISVPVDITNYVMLELGHPMHAYDAAATQGVWTVRKAQPGEVLVTLDNKERALDADDVIIADDQKILGLAGVMGGLSSEVTPQTTAVIFEAAIWDPATVQRTVKRHKVFSGAARRYTRGVDPDLSLVALNRAATLLTSIAGGNIAAQLTDQIPAGVGNLVAGQPIVVQHDHITRLLGVEYEASLVSAVVSSIGGEAEYSAGVFTVHPPSWRHDLVNSVDVIEEIVRLIGVDTVPLELPAVVGGRGFTVSQRLLRAITTSVAAAGLVEVPDPVFFDPRELAGWNVPQGDPRLRVVTVANPLDSAKPGLQTTLLPGLFATAGRNISRGNKDLAIFSQAQVSFAVPGTNTLNLSTLTRPSDAELLELNSFIPQQERHLAALWSGVFEYPNILGKGRNGDYTDAIELVRSIGDLARVDFTITSAAYAPFHPGRCASFVVDGVIVGHAGQIHPSQAAQYNLPLDTALLEINLSALPPRESLNRTAQVSPYPAVLQDVAVIVPDSVTQAQLRESLVAGAGDILESIRLYDVFVGDQIGVGKKSYTYSLVFRSLERTLTEHDASAARDAAVARACSDWGAVIRGPEYRPD